MDERVLRVREPDLAVEGIDRLDRIDALPPEVARVEIDHDVRPGLRPQLEKGPRAVGPAAGVELEADADAGRGPGGPGRELAPEGLDRMLPLPVDELLEVAD